MRKLAAMAGLCGLLLTESPADEFNRRVEFPQRIQEHQHVVENATVRLNPTGIIQIPFEQFRRIGFEHDLAAQVAQDLFDSPFAVTKEPNHIYTITDTRNSSQYTVAVLSEEITTTFKKGMYFVRNDDQKISLLFDMLILPKGNVTTYTSNVYVLPDTVLRRFGVRVAALYRGGAEIKRRIRELDDFAMRTYGGIVADPTLLKQLSKENYSPEKFKLLQSTFLEFQRN